jgi:uncharacterized protein YjbJ (UPF0337 family)
MSINKDQVKGRVEEAKGTIKEATGKLAGDETLEAKGNIQKNLGKVQGKLGDIEQEVKDSSKSMRLVTGAWTSAKLSANQSVRPSVATSPLYMRFLDHACAASCFAGIGSCLTTFTSSSSSNSAR